MPGPQQQISSLLVTEAGLLQDGSRIADSPQTIRNILFSAFCLTNSFGCTKLFVVTFSLTPTSVPFSGTWNPMGKGEQPHFSTFKANRFYSGVVNHPRPITSEEKYVKLEEVRSLQLLGSNSSTPRGHHVGFTIPHVVWSNLY